MKATLWGWFNTPNVTLQDPGTNERRPVAMSLEEAGELGIDVGTILLLETRAGQLIAVSAEKAGNPRLDEDKRCRCSVEPGSTAWLVMRLADGARARIAREFELA